MSRAIKITHMFEEQDSVEQYPKEQAQPALVTGFTLAVLFAPSDLSYSGVEEIAEKYKAKIVSKEVRVIFEYSGKDAEKIKKALMKDLKQLGGIIS